MPATKLNPTPPSDDDVTGNTAGNDTSSGPPTERYKVKLSHPLSHRKTVFNTVSERRARAFIANRFPRGEEAYLELPDGSTESYAAERAGPYGEDMDQWQPFDPDTYKPPEEQDPPGQSAWADVEG
jgi:hypothetical protein